MSCHADVRERAGLDLEAMKKRAFAKNGHDDSKLFNPGDVPILANDVLALVAEVERLRDHHTHMHRYCSAIPTECPEYEARLKAERERDEALAAKEMDEQVKHDHVEAINVLQAKIEAALAVPAAMRKEMLDPYYATLTPDELLDEIEQRVREALTGGRG